MPWHLLHYLLGKKMFSKLSLLRPLTTYQHHIFPTALKMYFIFVIWLQMIIIIFTTQTEPYLSVPQKKFLTILRIGFLPCHLFKINQTFQTITSSIIAPALFIDCLPTISYRCFNVITRVFRVYLYHSLNEPFYDDHL